jgi:hypothetical protein
MLINELAAFRQWVIYRADKVPLRCADGLRASPTYPADWSDYATAAAIAAAHPNEFGVGFVLTDNDPYTVIDLDTYNAKTEAIKARHNKIFEAFNTYTELSPSGVGVHIWCKGKIDARKVSGEALEVFSTGKYYTVTGNAINTSPIEERQAILNTFVEEIDAAYPRNVNNSEAFNLPQTLTDDEVCTRAANASNGHLFKRLWRGEWQELYPTQSEADITLCNLVAFWTDNKEQVGRIYWNSQLFLTSPKRKRKSRQDYLYNKKFGIVEKAFDQKIAPIDISAITAEWEKRTPEEILEPVEDAPTGEYTPDALAPPQEHWQRPAGLLGDITDYIYTAAVLPNIEVALAGAITFMAGICGRSYNTITGTGLNQYVVLLAGTGQGKEGAARGISKLYKAVIKMAPTISQYAGPSEIASSQALLKYLAESPCLWSHKNEFGFWLQKMNSKYAKPNELTLKGMLLDLFHKSGHDDILMGSIYSDRKNNSPSVKSPALTLYGESTPEEFYKAVDEANISEGLISRLTMIPVPDVRPSYNKDAALYQVPEELAWRIAGMVKRVGEIEQTNSCWKVEETPEAKEFQLQYQQQCMDKVWINRTEIVSKIWQRAHIRLLRLGALIAVGCNPDAPTVEVEHYEWAKRLINYGATALRKRFESGEVGQESLTSEQRKDLKRFLDRYTKMQWSEKLGKSYRITFDMWKVKAIPFAVIYQQVQGYSSFRRDNHPSQALQNVLREFDQAGYIMKVDGAKLAEWKKRGNVWCIVPE